MKSFLICLERERVRVGHCMGHGVSLAPRAQVDVGVFFTRVTVYI